MRAETVDGDPAAGNPTRGIFVGCCASAAEHGAEQRARRSAPVRIADFEFRTAKFKVTEQKFAENRNKAIVVLIIGFFADDF